MANGAPVVPDSPAITVDEQTAIIINSALAVGDPDLDARNGGAGDYSGATFTIRRDIQNADDLFTFASPGGAFDVDGSNLKWTGLTFGYFVQNAGSLTIYFTSLEAPATTALVNAALQRLLYTNLSDDPPASIILQYALNDGAPGAGQGEVVDGNNIDSGQVAVTITPQAEGPPAIIGTEDDDVLTGTPGNDTIEGLGGNDTIRGRGGNDHLYGGDGADFINGGFGDDTIDGGAGNDRAAYFQADSELGGVTVDLRLEGIAQNVGSQGWDTLINIENVSGTPFADVLTGNDGDNWLWGSIATIDIDLVSTSNNDMLDGQGGNDLLVVGLGNHIVMGGSGTDTLRFTENGADEPGVVIDLNLQGQAQETGAGSWTMNGIENLSGGRKDDTLIGDASGNTLAGDLGADSLIGGSGNDLLLGDGYINVNGTGASTVQNDQGTDGSDDTLDGGDGDDSLYGGGGNDTLLGGLGSDYINGGDGQDFVNYGPEDGWGAITVDLAAGTKTGGNGNDTLVSIEDVLGTGNDDTLIGKDGRNALNGGGGNDWIDGAGGDDWVLGAEGNDEIHGGDGNDQLLGDVGDDQLYGGDGNDELQGGLGDDLLDGGDGQDFANYGPEDQWGAITVDLSAGTKTGGSGNDILISIEDVLGTGNDDTLIGSDVYNALNGGGGDDWIDGAGDGDWIAGGEGEDQLFGGAGNDQLLGQDGNDVLRGNGDNDDLRGGSGDDLLVGGFGDDVIDGGDGYDRAGNYHTNASLGGVTIDLNLQGIAQNTGSQGWDTLIGIEYLSGTPWADTLTGDANDNVLWGSIATIDPGNWVSTTNNDTLNGGDGNDLLVVGIGSHSLTGGNGIDAVAFTENFGDDPAVRISLALQGVAQDTGAGFWTLNGIENLSGGDDNDELTGDGNANILGGNAGNDTLRGGAGNDALYGDGTFDSAAPSTGAPTLFADTGAAGNDTLEGGLGDDEIYGGGGIDTASYEHASGAVQVVLYANAAGDGDSTGADGEDLLSGIENITGSAFNDLLIGNNLDNVLAGGDGHDSLRGNGGNDTLLGGAGDDLLYGNAGNDYMDGGAGFDRVGYFSGATAGVTVDLRIQGVAQNTGQGMDTLVGIEHATGTAFSDTLNGNDDHNWLGGQSDGTADTIFGNGGQDLITDGFGDHFIDGGSDIDFYAFTSNTVPVGGLTISLALQGAAQNTGAGNLTLNNMEGLAGSISNDTLTGDSGGNWLIGDEGNDTLSGGAGNDQLYGDGRIAPDTHGTGGSGPIFLTFNIGTIGGATGDDILEGGLGLDRIDGGGGIDTAVYAHAAGSVTVTLNNNLTGNGSASGADGNDTLVSIENIIGSDYADTITGSAAANVLYGGAGNDFIQARGGDDIVYAGDGNDYLGGGTGNDYLDGGAGWDRASFSNGSTGPVTVDLRLQGVAQDTGLGIDTLIGIENVSGTAFSDTIIGDDGANWLWGGNDAPGAGDTIDGQGGDDLIENGVGDHTLIGGTGIDTFLFNPFTNPTNAIISLALQGAAQNTGAGTMTLSGFENLSGSSYSDTLIGDGNSNVLAGSEGDDTLIGGGGNDTLYGDGVIHTSDNPSGPIATYDDVATLGGVDGNDLLEGGLGNDIINGGGGIDTATYAHASGAVTVTLNATGGSSSGADGNDTLISIENVTGSAFNDTLNGNAAANVLVGGDGHDTLRGNGGDDSLYGGAGDDFIYGNAGDDLIDGGDGYDRAAFFVGATAGVTVDLRLQGTAQNTGQGMDTLVNIEHVSGTSFSDTLTGNNGSNWLWGSSDGAADTIDGQGGDDLIVDGAGDHLLTGGAGVDTFSFAPIVASAGATITLALQGTAQNTGNGMMTLSGFENLSGSGGNDTLTGDGNNNVLAGELGNDSLVGGDGNDTLYGDGSFRIDSHGIGSSGPIALYSDTGALFGVPDGDDVLEGGRGNDTLNGGGGTDAASYANASGAVIASLATGTASGADDNDTLISIENLIGSAFNDILTGDGGANVLDGGNGNDRLIGGAGNDALYGGAGSDTADYSGAVAAVTVNLVLGVATGTDIGSDALSSVENVVGGGGNDALFWASTAGNATFQGGGGTDTMTVALTVGAATSSPGTDLLATGNGKTDVVIATSGQSVTIDEVERIAMQGASSGGTITVSGNYATTSLTLVTVTAFAGIANDVLDARLLGSALRIEFFADNGDDTVFAAVSGANDLLDGGAGIDRLDYSAATAAVNINLVAGTATGAQIGTDTISSFEQVVGGSAGDTLTGSGLDERLDGGAGNDTITGGGGADTLIGGVGADILDGGAGIDTADYSGSSAGVQVNLQNGKGKNGAADNDSLTNIENVTGSAFDDQLNGSSGSNTLNGGAGNDLLIGGGGADILIGGAGSDTFRFVSTAEIGVGASTDSITDFNAGGANAAGRVDVIDLSAIDAKPSTANRDDAFSFIGSGAFTNKAGELRYDGAGHLLGDVNGDGVADFSLAIVVTGTLDASDFIL